MSRLHLKAGDRAMFVNDIHPYSRGDVVTITEVEDNRLHDGAFQRICRFGVFGLGTFPHNLELVEAPAPTQAAVIDHTQPVQMLADSVSMLAKAIEDMADGLTGLTEMVDDIDQRMKAMEPQPVAAGYDAEVLAQEPLLVPDRFTIGLGRYRMRNGAEAQVVSFAPNAEMPEYLWWGGKTGDEFISMCWRSDGLFYAEAGEGIFDLVERIGDLA